MTAVKAGNKVKGYQIAILFCPFLKLNLVKSFSIIHLPTLNMHLSPSGGTDGDKQDISAI